MSRLSRKRHSDDWSPWKDPLTLSALFLLGTAVVFGGATRLNAPQVALVELSALPLLVFAAGRAMNADFWSWHKAVFAIGAVVVAIPLLQLVPLPPAIWTGLPGREDMVLALSLVGVAPTWNPLTVSPDRTLASLLALIPPMAMFLAVLVAPQQSVVWLARLLLASAAVSIVLGAAQLASGSTQFYLWATTDAGHVVGFFANRNHLATLLVMALPFAAAFAAQERRRGARALVQSMAAGFLVLVMIALAGGGSRAGMLLFGPSLGLSVAIWLASAAPHLRKRTVIALALGALVVLALAVFAFAPVLDRFDGSIGEGGRLDSWKIVLQAIPTYLPVGAGTGSFDAVYRSVEPLSRLDPTFLNQAHNDWLEILIESGLFGAAALAAFCVWWAVRTVQVWRAKGDGPYFGRAASAAVLVLLLHSIVDYPVRTLTIAVVLALCVGVLERSVRSQGGASREIA